MAKATYAKNFRFFRAFRVRKKEETLCLCVLAFEIYCFRHLKKQGKTNKNI